MKRLVEGWRWRVAALAMTMLAAFCGYARAGEDVSKLKAAMKAAVTPKLQELSEKYKDLLNGEKLETEADACVEATIKALPAEVLNKLLENETQINFFAGQWATNVSDQITANIEKAKGGGQGDDTGEAKDDAAAETAADKADEGKKKEEKKAKPQTPRRWVWTQSEWKKACKSVDQLKERKGYEQTDYDSGKRGYVKNVVFSDRTFYYYESLDYSVYSDVGKNFTAELMVYTDKFVRTFPKVFPVKPRGKVMSKLVVVVFNEREQYKKVVGGTIAEWSRGVFCPVMPGVGWPQFTVYSYFYDKGNTDYDGEAIGYDADGVPIYRKPSEKDLANRKGADAGTPPNFSNFPYAVIQHEATHAMLRKYAGTSSYVYKRGEWYDNLPIFLNEACATFFENFDLHLSESKNLKRTAGLCSDRWLIAKYLKDNGDQDFDLAAALAMVNGGGRPGTWAPDDGGFKTAMNYATAQSFAHYLLARKNTSIFEDMMENVYAGRPVLDEKETKKIQKEWNKHIREVILTAEPEEGGSVSVHELKVDDGTKKDDGNKEKK